MVKKGWAVSFFCLCILSACALSEKWHTTTVIYFDTVCEIKVFSSSRQFKSAKEDVRRVFSEIECLFSPGAEDYTSPKVISLFEKAMDVHLNSDGEFDLSVAPLKELWGFVDRSYRIPDPEEIRLIVKLIDMTRIKQDRKNLILPAGMRLDWGGIAKGYGVDMAAASLRTMQIPKGFINAGGDLFCWGTNPDGQSWQIGIKHPRAEGFAGVLSLTNIAAATTGDYQRYFVRNGVRYHHIFNPHTGFPAAGKQSVTVIGPETTLCDALATALFVSAHPDTVLRHYPDYGAIIIQADGRLKTLGKEVCFQPVR